jgi:opacity protein-like surface antigen
MKTNNRLTQIIAAAVGCFVIVTSGYAQDTEIGKVEITGQAGIVGGVGTHASLALSGGSAINDRVFVLGEFSWIPLGGASTTVTSPNNFFEVASSGRILTFMAGAHYQFAQTRSLIPYAGGGLGVVHSSGSFTQTNGGVTTETSFGGDNFREFRWRRTLLRERPLGFKPELMFFFGEESFVRFGAGSSTIRPVGHCWLLSKISRRPGELQRPGILNNQFTGLTTPTPSRIVSKV